MILRTLCLCLAVLCAPLTKGSSTDETVFELGNVVVTEQDLVEYLRERLLPEAYGDALTRPGAVTQAIGNIFIIRSAAELAREKGLTKDTAERWEANDARDRYAVERLVAFETERRMQTVDWDALARERYAFDLESLGAGLEVSVSHILIASAGKTFKEMVAKVSRVEAVLAEGMSFQAAAEEFSEDPSVQRNQGALGYITRGQTHPSFEAAAFSMTEPESISEPVLTSFGIHFIQFHDRREREPPPFESLRRNLVNSIKEEQVDEYRALILEPMRDPAILLLGELDEPDLAARLLDLLSEYEAAPQISHSAP